ncbi:MAG: sugar ABC transporter substrate-binding protein [Lachnospiraceae bacterium]|nr:sugar ABC transporter substrate-binding protein [Lachnospiraceae bacterium]
MKRKLLVALMAVAMTASLAACGGGTDAPAAETPAEEAEETPAAEGEAETETPEEAPEADTAEGGLIQAAYLTKSRSEVWQLMSQGVVDQAADYGFEVTTMDCDMNASKQVEQVESCIEAGYKVIAISPADYDALSDVCKSAVEQGVHIVSIDGPNFNAQSYVAADEYDNAHGLGVKAGEWVNENWPEKETIKLCLLEYVYEEACIDRAAGMLDGFTETCNAEVEVVSRISPANQAEGNTMGESVFQATDVDVALGIAGDNMAGFCTAAESAGVEPDAMMAAAMDISKVSGEMMQEGKYIKLLGSWGSPSVDKAKVHLEAMKAAMEIEGLTDDPVRVVYDVSYVDESGIDQIMTDFGWN